mmetsp:Transcript_30469/g.99495  ORF Transcript_30469/g.99495 Transcript_30469/m.99495 type:complete len:207 (+) Transcript_30469:727-1347(+)
MPCEGDEHDDHDDRNRAAERAVRPDHVVREHLGQLLWRSDAHVVHHPHGGVGGRAGAVLRLRLPAAPVRQVHRVDHHSVGLLGLRARHVPAVHQGRHYLVVHRRGLQPTDRLQLLLHAPGGVGGAEQQPGPVQVALVPDDRRHPHRPHRHRVHPRARQHRVHCHPGGRQGAERDAAAHAVAAAHCAVGHHPVPVLHLRCGHAVFHG